MPTGENQYACHDLSVGNIFNKRPKLTFAQSKRFPPKQNLLDRENNSMELGRVFPTDPPFLARRDNNDGRPLHGT